MRAQAIEKVLRRIIIQLEQEEHTQVDPNIIHKAKIILDRDDNRSASVIREMINSEE